MFDASLRFAKLGNEAFKVHYGACDLGNCCGGTVPYGIYAYTVDPHFDHRYHEGLAKVVANVGEMVDFMAVQVWARYMINQRKTFYMLADAVQGEAAWRGMPQPMQLDMESTYESDCCRIRTWHVAFRLAEWVASGGREYDWMLNLPGSPTDVHAQVSEPLRNLNSGRDIQAFMFSLNWRA